MKEVQFKKFSAKEHETWKILFERQKQKRDIQIVPLFSKGLEILKITEKSIPNLEDVNTLLNAKTGWTGIPVEGLEEGVHFFQMLSNKKFPIGNFIRDQKDLSYTPAPDIFHDLYGHIPFFTDPSYADFCEQFGKVATQYSQNPQTLREFERYFWFTIEFGLITTPLGKRIFGAGIASSYNECAYALSDSPKVVKFDIEIIRRQEFRIDILQETLFLLDSPQQLYKSLETFEKNIITQ